jgi:hypothetical protein
MTSSNPFQEAIRCTSITRDTRALSKSVEHEPQPLRRSAAIAMSIEKRCV